ncbi:hypothetical protein PACTADRAFT_34592 [Pachysolen tannophilus NRRL Y-2460]|uniref:Uncharacterized protein n=1 Tax=Pachysolen tannophilus NRRL Y-2460 TaxID=669874 RepID=A0A1E4TSW3_PACTA|nr:hypothetical protein PACTADRAFT_34592 [Pachysolen tannophilus NRRL Y-2460]
MSEAIVTNSVKDITGNINKMQLNKDPVESGKEGETGSNEKKSKDGKVKRRNSKFKKYYYANRNKQSGSKPSSPKVSKENQLKEENVNQADQANQADQPEPATEVAIENPTNGTNVQDSTSKMTNLETSEKDADAKAEQTSRENKKKYGPRRRYSYFRRKRYSKKSAKDEEQDVQTAEKVPDEADEENQGENPVAEPKEQKDADIKANTNGNEAAAPVEPAAAATAAVAETNDASKPAAQKEEEDVKEKNDA